jgi:hypothetical protein
MPILQSRLIALINAARDYEAAALQLQRMIISQAQAAHTHQISAEEAITNILLFTDGPLPIQTSSAVTIAVELKHFQVRGHENRRAAQRAEARRREAGTPPLEMHEQVILKPRFATASKPQWQLDIDSTFGDDTNHDLSSDETDPQETDNLTDLPGVK